MNVHRFEVDGIPVFGVAVDGPVRAGLVFRVGGVDEPPARRGITHVVEHLAIGRTADPRFNGWTGPTFTAFVADGTDGEVRDYLSAVCDALTNLPIDRLEHERRVLTTEAMQDGHEASSYALQVRFGLSGWGALDLGQVGLSAVSAAEVEAWSREWFTRGNAAAYVVAPDPQAVLRSLRLPDGEWQPRGEQQAIVGQLPAFSFLPAPGATISLVGRRGVALRWGMDIVAARARDKLRFRDGVVYDVGSYYEPMAAETCHVGFGADALDDHKEEVLPGLLDALRAVRTLGPTDAEVARVRRAEAEASERAGVSDVALEWACYAAFRQLEGAPPESSDELAALVDAVDEAAIQRALDDACPTAIAVLPYGAAPPPAPWVHAPDSSPPIDTRTLGRVRRFRSATSPSFVVAIGDGVLVATAPDSHQIVIRSASCPLVFTEDDGSRVVWNACGFNVAIDPWLWHNGDALVAEIDRFAPQSSYVRAGPGHEKRPPRPMPRWIEVAALPVAMLSILRLVILLFEDPDTVDSKPAIAAFCAVLALAGLGVTWMRRRRWAIG